MALHAKHPTCCSRGSKTNTAITVCLYCVMFKSGSFPPRYPSVTHRSSATGLSLQEQHCCKGASRYSAWLRSQQTSPSVKSGIFHLNTPLPPQQLVTRELKRKLKDVDSEESVLAGTRALLGFWRQWASFLNATRGLSGFALQPLHR